MTGTERDSSNTRLDAAFDEWFRARAAEHFELHGNAVSAEMYEAVGRAFRAGAAVERPAVERLVAALRELCDHVAIDESGGQHVIRINEGYTFAVAVKDAKSALAEFGQQPTGDEQ